MFAEVKRHKPSVIFIPNIEDWEDIITGTAFTTFQAMLKSIPPTDPVLLLATSEVEPKELPEWIGKGLFGLSSKNQTEVERPTKVRNIPLQRPFDNACVLTWCSRNPVPSISRQSYPI